MLDQRYLIAFITLMRERSVTRAADKLNVSQPALSATLRKLREKFGDPLFVRVGRDLSPTDRALEILKTVQQISRLLETIDRDAVSFDPLTDRMSLRIQASDHTHSLLLSRVMAALVVEAPLSELTVQPLMYEKLETAFDEGELDFAILPDYLAPPSMQMRRMFEETFVCVMRKGHALADEELSLERLAGCQHVRVAPVLKQGKNRLDAAFAEAGVSRETKLTVPNYSAVPDIVASTDLISFFPSSAATSLDDRFVVRSSPVHLEPIKMSLIWHPRKQMSVSHKWTRDFLIGMAPSFSGS